MYAKRMYILDRLLSTSSVLDIPPKESVERDQGNQINQQL